MLSNLLSLLLNSSFLMLRLGGGSFPRPLRAEEERHYLALAAQGDEEARGILIEHNLRLVAHIIKNGESEGKRSGVFLRFSLRFTGGAPAASRPGGRGPGRFLPFSARSPEKDAPGCCPSPP